MIRHDRWISWSLSLSDISDAIAGYARLPRALRSLAAGQLQGLLEVDHGLGILYGIQRVFFLGFYGSLNWDEQMDLTWT